MTVVPFWVEAHCVVPDGFRKGQPFRLYEYQGRYLANFYTVRGEVEYHVGHPVLGPAFLYRRGLLVGPQKLGKNPLIAAQVCVEGAGPALFAGWAGRDDGYACSEHGCRCGWEYQYDPGEPMGMSWPTPLIQITAFSEDSTENTYDALRPMIEQGPLADVIPKTGEEFIRLPGGGRIDTVTSSNQSRLGQRVTFVPQDELGLWTARNKMVKLADTQYRNLSGMGGRASLTSNAWDPAEHSVAQQQYESATSDIYRQFTQPPKSLSYGDKRERRKIHLAVYPADVLRENGGHVDLDGIESEAADLVLRDKPQAERFYGNKVVAGAGSAVESEVWDALVRQREIQPGEYIGLGFDGSSNRDASVLQGCTRDGFSFSIKVWERPVRDEMIRWQSRHPGQEWKVDRVDVRDTIRQTFATYEVGRMQCDPWRWQTEIQDWADEFGEEVVVDFDTSQPKRIAPAVDRWRTAIIEGTHTHDGNPVINDHVKNTHLEKVRLSDEPDDGHTRYRLVKGEDRKPIDGCLAEVLAFDAAMTMPPPIEWNMDSPAVTFID